MSDPPIDRAATTAATTASEFLMGLRLLGRGLGIAVRSPHLLLLGILPAAVAALLLLAVLGVLLYFVTDLSALVTWFADDWSSGWRTTVRWAAGITFVACAVFVSMIAYTWLALTIGNPFYEAISARVDQMYGGAPDLVDVSWYRSLAHSAVDSARVLIISLAAGFTLFLAGFLPLAGQTVVPVAQAMVGGWLLAMEISGVAFGRRAYRLSAQYRLLRPHRAAVLGFGVPLFLAFLIPFVAVLLMPGAVAGGTLLARRVLGQPFEEAPAPGPATGLAVAGTPGPVTR